MISLSKKKMMEILLFVASVMVTVARSVIETERLEKDDDET